MGDSSSDTPITSPEPSTMPSVVEGLNGASTHYDYPERSPSGPYRILDQYHSRPRKLKVACVGAGASGLCLAYKMQKMLEEGSWELTLFEKNPACAGTWYENTYPGVACDIPSHLYTFTFDPKPDWTYYFAHGDEIQQYFESFADRHSLRKYMKLDTKVIKAQWNDSDAIWNITLEHQVTKQRWSDWAHCLVNGAGTLNYN